MIAPKLTTAQRLDLAAEILLVRHFSSDGQRLVRVPLSGKSGVGHSMILEADIWKAGRENGGWPPNWRAVCDRKSGRLYVVTRCKPISVDNRSVSLARIIANAGPEEVVKYRDGDTLNLRRVNLEKLSRSEFQRRYYGHREIQEVAVYDDDLGVPF